jgi:cytochrome c peroxidase
MRQYIFITVLFMTISVVAVTPGCLQSTRHPETTKGTARIKEKVQQQIGAFRAYVNDSLLPLAMKSNDKIALQQAFLRTRILYKKMEWATEYFMPATSRMVNGAPLPEIENEENKVVQPDGLQVIEAMLYPEPDTSKRAELVRQTRLLNTRAAYYENYWNNQEPDSAQVMDALQLEIFRNITLGISGFDAALAQSGIQESAAVFASVKEALQVFAGNGIAGYADSLLKNAVDYLQAHPGFNDFDRLHFISQLANPISREMARLQRRWNIEPIKDNRLLRPGTATLFDKDAFNVNAYTPDSSYYFTIAKAQLGEKLFYDNRLSSNNTRSCGTCHDPGKGFTDGLTTSIALSAGFVKRNAPTLLNAALQPSLFYDLRSTSLENQAADVITNKDEMHGNLHEMVRVLETDTSYTALLNRAWPGENRWTPFHLQNALASYIRSLTGLNSRFDQYMQGIQTALEEEEKRGFNLFMGKAKCGTCHFMPLFNGTVPPAFGKIESEVIGVPLTAAGKQPDTDPGRFALYKLEPYKNAFKTPTVRNIALTAPYMHNGIYRTLEEVVDFYEKGGGAGLGLDVGNQTLPFDKLQLSKEEKKAIIAFMKSLTDNRETALQNRH